MNNMDELELVSGRDTTLHSHSFDRTPTQDTLEGLSTLERVRTITSSTAASATDDILRVDTTAGAVTLTLPIPKNGKRYIISRVAGANNVTVQGASGNINGSATATIAANYTPLRLKAIGTNYENV
jgi:hypothetical protein